MVQLRSRTPARRIAIVCAAAVALGLAGAPAAPRGKGMSTTGTVRIPSVRSDVTIRAALCAWLTGGARSQGELGHMIVLRAAGAYDFQRYTLEPLNDELLFASAGSARLAGPAFDVAFFGPDPGTCEAPSPIGVRYAAGKGRARARNYVPFGARYALVVRVAAAGVVPRVCYGGICSFRPVVHASDHVGPEPFRFTIHRGRW